MSDASALALVRTILNHYERQPANESAARREVERVLGLLRAIPTAHVPLAPSAHPIVRHLAPALSAPAPHAAAVVAELGAIGPRLPWRYAYAERADAPDLGDRIAFAEIVGPDAPLRSDTVCLGLTLIAPNTLYPDHRHPAIELYCVLSGTATWSAGGRAALVPPGTFVLHPSGVSHAMETHAEPLLAVYTWSGDDVRTPSAYS
ncbi:MAG: dimethylsulfonioproprionate lyase family protein [Anaeromyxobacteraceae bacterium]